MQLQDTNAKTQTANRTINRIQSSISWVLRTFVDMHTVHCIFVWAIVHLIFRWYSNQLINRCTLHCGSDGKQIDYMFGEWCGTEAMFGSLDSSKHYLHWLILVCQNSHVFHFIIFRFLCCWHYLEYTYFEVNLNLDCIIVSMWWCWRQYIGAVPCIRHSTTWVKVLTWLSRI